MSTPSPRLRPRARPPVAPGRGSRPVSKSRRGVAPRFIDLFAGIGGMRQAFERAGGRCVFTSEYDSYAVQTYAKNFPGEVHGDITAIDPKSIFEIFRGNSSQLG